MSHPAQRKFCRSVRRKFPLFFKKIRVVDIGSLDINGNNRYLFKKSMYTGIDVVYGDNVDLVMRGHEYLDTCDHIIDTIISTECLEHDSCYKLTLSEMYKKLKSGGLLLITCAGEGRKEHGTYDHHPKDSPGTNDYYTNITNEMFSEILKPDMFKVYHLEQVNTDLQFYGIKNY